MTLSCGWGQGQPGILWTFCCLVWSDEMSSSCQSVFDWWQNPRMTLHLHPYFSLSSLSTLATSEMFDLWISTWINETNYAIIIIKWFPPFARDGDAFFSILSIMTLHFKCKSTLTLMMGHYGQKWKWCMQLQLCPFWLLWLQNPMTVFSRESDSTITNVCSSVRSSVCPQNP